MKPAVSIHFDIGGRSIGATAGTAHTPTGAVKQMNAEVLPHRRRTSMKSKPILPAIALVAAVALSVSAFAGVSGKLPIDDRTSSRTELPPYKNSTLSPLIRANDLLSRMTLEEKIAYCSGVRDQFIRDLPRRGLPAINMQDGPIGVHGGGTTFPPAIALASSFDPDLMFEVGQALGRDSRAIGVHVTLGPAMNIVRAPILGRAAEYYGEDPWLAARMVPELIRGVQSQGAMACAKHFIGNELELVRTSSDSQIDERTLREIYLPPFESAVRANVATVMGAYNHINGIHACVNPHTLHEILRTEWGFTGFVMSDWGAGSGPTNVWAMGPLDLAMPSGPMGEPTRVMPLIEAGKINPAVYDVKVGHILRKLIEFGVLDRAQKDDAFQKRDPASRAVALRASREGTVLLKNENNALPLDCTALRSIALIGPNAELDPNGAPYVTGIAGSSSNDCPEVVSIAQAIRELAGDRVKVVVVPDHIRTLYETTAYEHPGADGKPEPGLQASYFKNLEFSGTPDLQRVDKDLNFSHGWRIKGWLKELRPFGALAVRWTGAIRPKATGQYCFAKESNPGMKVWLDGELVIDDEADFARTHWVRPTSGVVRKLEANRAYALKVEYVNRPEVAHMVGVRFGWGPAQPMAEIEAARSCDAVVACVGFGFMTEGEGFDRTWELPYGQAELLKAVAAANPRTIVVATGGGAFETSGWVNRVPAMLQAWYLADKGGKAIAEILFGRLNPSGKLPVTFAKRWEDNPAAPYFQADWSKTGMKPVDYREGIFVGYRGFERSGVEPLFPFGHGLSYTKFEYRNLKIQSDGNDAVTVTCDIANTGSRGGAEVAQLYLGDRHAPVPRPPKELKGFSRIELQPGEVKPIRFQLGRRDFSYYDVTAKAWTASPGSFEISLGGSSRDIRLHGQYELKPRTAN